MDALGEEPYVWTEDDDYARGMRYQWKSDHDAIEALPSAQQKPLKYTGESICLYCWTVNCDGCMYEPVMEAKR